jgi:hypothetical protein
MDVKVEDVDTNYGTRLSIGRVLTTRRNRFYNEDP